jgi:hypothetical protein
MKAELEPSAFAALSQWTLGTFKCNGVLEMVFTKSLYNQA